MTERERHAADYIRHVGLFTEARRVAPPGAIPTSILYAEGLNAKYILETDDPTPDAWIPWAEQNGYMDDEGKITQTGYDKIMEPIA